MAAGPRTSEAWQVLVAVPLGNQRRTHHDVATCVSHVATSRHMLHLCRFPLKRRASDSAPQGRRLVVYSLRPMLGTIAGYLHHSRHQIRIAHTPLEQRGQPECFSVELSVKRTSRRPSCTVTDGYSHGTGDRSIRLQQLAAHGIVGPLIRLPLAALSTPSTTSDWRHDE